MTETQESGMQLQKWAVSHQPKFYEREYWSQVLFVRDRVAGILAPTYEEYREIQDSRMKVVSEHAVKGVALPVFQVKLADNTVFTMRCNFRDWIVSVNSLHDIEADFMGLFNPNNRICELYYDFPEGLIYGPYAENKKQFTIELPSENYLFAFFWIFAHQVVGNRNKDGRGT